MIRYEEKREEYRKITPFYKTRFRNAVGMLHNDKFMAAARQMNLTIVEGIVLRAGYSIESPAMLINGTIRIGTGRKEWGAEENTEYFVIDITSVEMLCTDDWQRENMRGIEEWKNLNRARSVGLKQKYQRQSVDIDTMH